MTQTIHVTTFEQFAGIGLGCEKKKEMKRKLYYLVGRSISQTNVVLCFLVNRLITTFM